MAANAIVVGVRASAGVGGALCRRFAREGLHVCAAGRTKENLEALAEEIEGLGGRLMPVVTDARRSGAIEGRPQDSDKCVQFIRNKRIRPSFPS